MPSTISRSSSTGIKFHHIPLFLSAFALLLIQSMASKAENPDIVPFTNYYFRLKKGLPCSFPFAASRATQPDG